MKAISIRGPWWFFILTNGKDIENRTRNWKYRGPILIHASAGMTKDEYGQACFFAHDAGVKLFPEFETLHRGGIVGQVEITGCVTASPSPWFTGPYGLVLANPKALPFRPCQGRLGIFEVEIEAARHD